jgi:hypothetical protein
MASDLSKYLGNKLCRWLGGIAMPAAPAALYIALYNGDPKGAGADVTTTVNASGRVTCSFTVPASNDTDNVLINSSAANFGASAGDTDVSHFAVFDSAVGGKRLGSKAVLGGTVSVLTGTPVSFEAGDLAFEIGS